MNDKLVNLNVMTDPGHGWGIAPREDLANFGLLDKVSPYSYEKGDLVFLEEDCDLGLYVLALKARGYEIKFVENHTNFDSRIRNYARFNLPAGE